MQPQEEKRMKLGGLLYSQVLEKWSLYVVQDHSGISEIGSFGRKEQGKVKPRVFIGVSVRNHKRKSWGQSKMFRTSQFK